MLLWEKEEKPKRHVREVEINACSTNGLEAVFRKVTVLHDQCPWLLAGSPDPVRWKFLQVAHRGQPKECDTKGKTHIDFNEIY